MAEPLTPEQVIALAEQVAQILAAQSQGVGEVTKVTSLDGVYSLPALLFTGTDETVVEAPISLLRIWIQRSTDAIQWKQGDTGEWQNLITIPDLTGPKGETPEFRTGSTGIEWKYTNEEDAAWRPLVSIDQLKLTFDMLTEAQKETIRGYSAFQLWQQEEGNTDKTYDDYKTWIKKDALDAAQTALNATDQTNKVKKETEQVKKETEDVQARTDQVRINTLTTKLDTEDILNETRQVQQNTEQTRIKTLSTDNATGETRKETERTGIRTDQVRIDTLTTKLDTEDILHTTRQVQQNTEQTRIKTLSTEKTTGQTKSETEKTQKRTDLARIETLKVKQSTEEVLKEVKETILKNEHLIIRTKSIADETEQIKRNTEAVSAIAKELNDHPGKPIGGYWFFWDIEKQEYINSNIQAKGDVGSSFKIIGRYDTLEALKTAVPDGTDIDGVFAIGLEEPYSYYAWLVIDGVWQWDNQGQLRGAPGKTAFDVWLEEPENAGKTLADFFNYLSPYIGKNKNWWVRDYDTDIKAPGTDAYSPKVDPDSKKWLVFDDDQQKYVDSGVLAEGVSVKVEIVKDTPTEYILKFIFAGGEYTTPNMIGRSGSAVLDIDHIPGPEDTHYIYNGVEYNYSIGDMRRYVDTSRNKITMYICMDLSNNTALWQKLGSGTGGGMALISGGTAASRLGSVYKITGGNAASTGDDDIRTGGTASEIFE